jgi:hypothetical protein
VLGVTYLCTDTPSNHNHRPAAVLAVQADAGLGAGVVTSPSSHGPGKSNPGSGNPGYGNPGNNPGTSNPGTKNPGPSTNPGSSHSAPDCGCGTNNPPLINVKPDVDADVDVVVKLPDTGVNAPGLVGGVLGTVGTVVDVVLPDCGCSPDSGLPAALPLPLLGH